MNQHFVYQLRCSAEEVSHRVRELVATGRWSGTHSPTGFHLERVRRRRNGGRNAGIFSPHIVGTIVEGAGGVTVSVTLRPGYFDIAFVLVGFSIVAAGWTLQNMPLLWSLGIASGFGLLAWLLGFYVQTGPARNAIETALRISS